MADKQSTPPSPKPGNGEVKAPRRGRTENLKPAKPGEVRNPKGINGRAQREAFAAFCDETYPGAKKGQTRIQAVYEAMFRKALRGGDGAQRMLVEQYQGKARQHVQVTGENEGPLRITYDEVRTKLDSVARAAIGAAADAANPDAGDATADQD